MVIISETAKPVNLPISVNGTCPIYCISKFLLNNDSFSIYLYVTTSAVVVLNNAVFYTFCTFEDPETIFRCKVEVHVKTAALGCQE